MRCAYCKEEKKLTKEHIISDGILELFPECDLTIDRENDRYYKSDPVIKDVCSNCNNNRLTYIDSYAKSIVENYFIDKYKKDDVVELKYDFSMIEKMLLKFTFNAMRANSEDISFFNESIIEYLLNQEHDVLNKKITILAGLKVNTSPVPDFWLNNIKLSWVKSPVFFSVPMMIGLEGEKNGKYSTKGVNILNLDKLDLSYMFNFNSGIFIILVWNDELSEEEFAVRNKVLEYIYPYTVLKREETKCKLQRCTHAFNWFKPELVDCSTGIELVDRTNAGLSYDIDIEKGRDELSKGWETHERKIKEKDIESKIALKNKKIKKKKEKKESAL